MLFSHEDYTEELTEWWKFYYEKLTRDFQYEDFKRESGITPKHAGALRKILQKRQRWLIEHLCAACNALNTYFEKENLELTPAKVLSLVEKNLEITIALRGKKIIQS